MNHVKCMEEADLREAETDTASFGVRMPVQLAEAFERAAAEEERTVSAQLRFLIRNYVATQQEERQATA